MANEERLSLKVLVDNEKKRVVFAEANSDFVDVIFSFLTLPLGTIVKLLTKNSGLGSIDNLYESIEQLGDQHFRTEVYRNMFLSPRSAAEKYCEALKLNIDGNTEPRVFYHCNMDECTSSSPANLSFVGDTRCHYCGKFIMDGVGKQEKYETTENGGVFVKRNSAKFIITDDFHVKPSSLLQFYDILEELGEKDFDILEERTLEFGKEELLKLLRNLLIRKEVLTNICFPDLCIRSTTPMAICKNGVEMKRVAREGNRELGMMNTEIKLFINKTNNKVVCAEIEDELVDQLFSFLTFPLGAVLKLIDCSNSLGCMTNLYSSLQEMKFKYLKPAIDVRILRSPQLAPFFQSSFYGLRNRYLDYYFEPRSTIECKYGVNQPRLGGPVPKTAKINNYLLGGFVTAGQNFLITDELHVSPISLRTVTQILKQQGLHVDHLAKREMIIGRAEIVDLLRAMLISMLISETTLSDALSLHDK